MSFLDKLSSLFKIDISKLKEIHLFSDNASHKIEYHDNRTININVGACSPIQKEQLQAAVLSAVQKDNHLLLETQAKELLDSFSAIDKVEEKIVLNKKYGISRLNIHGIGYDNVAKIQELLNELKKSIKWPPDIDSERGFITVKITF